MFAEVRGARLWFDVVSAQVAVQDDRVVTRPTVVGVHGGPGIDSTALLGVLQPLAAVAHTIRFDQRGHGRSDHGQPSEWTVESWADDTAGLIEWLGLESPVLLGTSFGASVALTCASRHPGLLGGVVCAYGGGRLDLTDTIEAFRRLGGDRAARAAAGDPSRPEESHQTWLEVCWPLVSRTADGVKRLEQMQALSIHSHDVHAAHTQKGLESRPLTGLETVTCPVLVLGGMEDPMSTPTVMRELAGSLTASANLKLVLIPEAGHTLFMDQPEPAYRAVTDFLHDVTR